MIKLKDILLERKVDWKKADKYLTGSAGIEKFVKINMKDLQYFVKNQDEKGLKDKLNDILAGIINAARSSGIKL
jgi:hypothetical protein